MGKKKSDTDFKSIDLAIYTGFRYPPKNERAFVCMVMNFLVVTLTFSAGNLYHVFTNVFCRSTRCHVLKHLGF